MSKVTPLNRRLLAEALGTAFLLATIIGSGVMGETLSSSNAAVALLGNTLATGAILAVLITIFGPVSGAHFNPAVSLAFAVRGELPLRDALLYAIVQIAGAIIGVWAAHVMFDLPLWQVSGKIRFGPGQWFSEWVATFGLGLTIFGCTHCSRASAPAGVGLYITAAYWFTASTSFANPAVTLARALSNTFAGIAPSGVAAFVIAQLVGMAAAVWAAEAIWLPSRRHEQKSS